MDRISSLKQAPTDAMNVAFDRVEALEPTYVKAAQRLKATLSWDLLVSPVDRARNTTAALTAAWADGDATEAEVIEAASALARLMAMVIASH